MIPYLITGILSFGKTVFILKWNPRLGNINTKLVRNNARLDIESGGSVVVVVVVVVQAVVVEVMMAVMVALVSVVEAVSVVAVLTHWPLGDLNKILDR